MKTYPVIPNVEPWTYANQSDACFDISANFATPMFGALGYGDDFIAIEPGCTIVVPTGMRVHLPEHTYLAIYGRSGISAKTHLRIANSVGIIDAAYRDEVMVLIQNTSSRVIGGEVPNVVDITKLPKNFFEYPVRTAYPTTYLIPKGARIAQGMVLPKYMCDFRSSDTMNTKETLVSYSPEATYTFSDEDRGGGMGSSGV